MSMKNIVLGLLMAALVSGCADNRASFFVQGILEMQETCTAEPSNEGPFITGGGVDLAYSGGYLLYPQLVNQLSPRADSQSLVAETNGILVEGANVRYWYGGRAQGDPIYGLYQPAACYVPPNGIASCPFNALQEYVVGLLLEDAFGTDQPPAGDLFTLDTKITIGIQYLGTTNGGTELETPEFYFTLDVCYNCSTDCSTVNDEGVLCGTGSSPEEPTTCPGYGGMVDCCAVYNTATCSTLCGY